MYYADDTFVIWPHGFDKLGLFHSHLNSLKEFIQFANEKEGNNCLPFQDVLVTKERNHRVPPFTERNTQVDIFITNHTIIQELKILYIVSCLHTRAERACTGVSLTREKEHLCDVFMANGYPEEIVRKSNHKHKSKRTKGTEEETTDSA